MTRIHNTPQVISSKFSGKYLLYVVICFTDIFSCIRNGLIWISKRSFTPFFFRSFGRLIIKAAFFAAIFVCMQRYNISKLCHKSVMWTCISFWSTTPLLPGKAQLGKIISECYSKYCFSLNDIILGVIFSHWDFLTTSIENIFSKMMANYQHPILLVTIDTRQG